MPTLHYCIGIPGEAVRMASPHIISIARHNAGERCGTPNDVIKSSSRTTQQISTPDIKVAIGFYGTTFGPWTKRIGLSVFDFANFAAN